MQCGPLLNLSPVNDSPFNANVEANRKLRYVCHGLAGNSQRLRPIVPTAFSIADVTFVEIMEAIFDYLQVTIKTTRIF